MHLTKRGKTEMDGGNMLLRMRDEMERMFDRFIRDPFELVWHPENGKTWFPALDVIDNETEVVVKAEVPGLEPKDVNVALSGNTLTISGHKDESSEEKGENFYMSERSFGAFRRAVTLPEGVDADKVKAEQKDGVLTVRVGKHKTAKARQIPVQPGKPG